MNKPSKLYPFYILVTSLIVLDQLTKILVKGFHLFGISHEGMDYGSVIPVIGNFLQWTYIENAGMAFGITFGAGKIFLSLFSIFASVGLGWYLFKIKEYSPWVKAGISLIMAGAIGNLIDRVFYGVFWGEMPLFYGKVVDFIQVDIPDMNFFGLFYTHFPVFNVADSCVTCGVILLLLSHKHIPGFSDIFGKQQELNDGAEAESNDIKNNRKDESND